MFRAQTATWYSLLSSNNSLKTQAWGTSGDQTVPADYDGDGKTDIAVWRPANATLYELRSATNTLHALAWGTNGDVFASSYIP